MIFDDSRFLLKVIMAMPGMKCFSRLQTLLVRRDDTVKARNEMLIVGMKKGI